MAAWREGKAHRLVEGKMFMNFIEASKSGP